MAETENSKSELSLVFTNGDEKLEMECSDSKRGSLISQEGGLALEEAKVEEEGTPKTKSKRRRPLSGFFKKNAEAKKEEFEEDIRKANSVPDLVSDEKASSEENEPEDEDATKDDSYKEKTSKGKRHRLSGIFKKKESTTSLDKSKSDILVPKDGADEVDNVVVDVAETPVEANDDEAIKEEITLDESPSENTEVKKKKTKRRFSISKKKKPKVTKDEIPDEFQAEENKEKESGEQSDQEVVDDAPAAVEPLADKESETRENEGNQSETEIDIDETAVKSDNEETKEEQAPEESAGNKDVSEVKKRRKSLRRRLSITKMMKSRKSKSKTASEEENTAEQKDDEQHEPEVTEGENTTTCEENAELDIKSESDFKAEEIACKDESTEPEPGLAATENISSSDEKQEEVNNYGSYLKLGFVYNLYETIFKQKDKMSDISVEKSRELVLYAFNFGYLKVSEASGSILSQAKQAPRKAIFYVVQMLVKKYPQCFTKLRKSRKAKGKKNFKSSEQPKKPVTETHI